MIRSQVLGIFAKQPRPGRVKTRLCPPLTERQAARLYDCCLRETVRRACAGNWQPVLFFEGEKDFFSRTFADLTLVEQQGEDLGTRLARAFAQGFAAGAQRMVVIGSDSPDLPGESIEGAFAALGRHDAVVAPADDGGYVLIGLQRPCAALFQDIPWSTPGVLEATRERIAELGLRYQQLPAWYDLDNVAALRHLIHRSPDSDTARLAARLLDPAAP